jgi:hypothetical protein
MGIYLIKTPSTILCQTAITGTLYPYLTKGSIEMTETDYTARKKRMAALLANDVQTLSIEISQSPLPPAREIGLALVNPSDALTVDLTNNVHHLIQILLLDIEIDLHQPRQFFPADLRKAFAHHEITHHSVIAQLSARMANGDREAEAYFLGIQGLAEDIQARGQLSAVLVYPLQSPNNTVKYQLIDGERRFWAHVYLSLQPGSTVSTMRAEVRTDLESASADDILGMQWSANMQRDNVCAIDIAEFVHAKREEAVRHIELDPQLLAAWRKGEQSGAPRDAAQHMVCHDLAHTFGRPLKRRAYYQYLSLVEKLAAPVKVLARAHKIPLSRLIQITSQPEREQMAATLLMIESLGAPEDGTKKPVTQPKRPGRPTRSQSRINLAERAVAGMDSDTEQMLQRWNRDELAAVLQKDRDLIEATNRHQRLVQSTLAQR